MQRNMLMLFPSVSLASKSALGFLLNTLDFVHFTLTCLGF